mgnify:CR=1 FL=1
MITNFYKNFFIPNSRKFFFHKKTVLAKLIFYSLLTQFKLHPLVLCANTEMKKVITLQVFASYNLE